MWNLQKSQLRSESFSLLPLCLNSVYLTHVSLFLCDQLFEFIMSFIYVILFCFLLSLIIFCRSWLMCTLHMWMAEYWHASSSFCSEFHTSFYSNKSNWHLTIAWHILVSIKQIKKGGGSGKCNKRRDMTNGRD